MITLEIIARSIIFARGKPVLVGGCVRDYLMHQKSNEFDVEVYDITFEKLTMVLRQLGRMVVVGKSFGVVKITNFDISLPRIENKSGYGYKGFDVLINNSLTYKLASKRRDFTINSVGIEIITRILLDPNLGQFHISKRKIQHVSVLFGDDPLRILRGCQFISRLNFYLSLTTINKCSVLYIELVFLSRERIGVEFKKIILSQNPVLGLSALLKTKSEYVFPEIKALIACPQDNVWHPEGDVWNHTSLVMSIAGKISKSFIIRMAAFCHDIAKPKTTKFERKRWRSKNHEIIGRSVAEKFLNRLSISCEHRKSIILLISEHLKPFQLFIARNRLSGAAIQRLATRVNIVNLSKVSRADFLGRATIESNISVDFSSIWLLREAKKLNILWVIPGPFIKGRHLKLLLKTINGILLGKILKHVYEMQISEQLLNLNKLFNYIVSVGY